MRKYILEISLAIGLSISLIIGAFALDTQKDIANKLIRLHVIGNSDSKEDQSLKLLVRDEVLKHISKVTMNCKSIDEARAVVERELDTIEEISNEIIAENGFTYSSTAELSNVHFPTKDYEEFSLPAGRYDALRIKLGKASGQNWWCVLFPPVCVSAAEAETELQNAGMTEKEIRFVTSSEPEYRFKFKIVEIIDKIAHRF